MLEMDISELEDLVIGEEIEEHVEEFPFHPCHTPRGLTWYDFSVLTAFQQKHLNELKADTVRDDNKYLAANPEFPRSQWWPSNCGHCINIVLNGNPHFFLRNLKEHIFYLSLATNAGKTKLKTIRRISGHSEQFYQIYIVRAILVLLLREVFKTKHETKPIYKIIKAYFDRPLDEIRFEIDQYLKDRGEPLKKQGDSAIKIHAVSSVSSLEDIPSLYYPHYFSYLSYTDGQSMTEFVPDESSLEYQEDYETDMESMLTYSPEDSQEDLNPDHLVVTRVGTETNVTECSTSSQRSEINIDFLDYLRGNYGE